MRLTNTMNLSQPLSQLLFGSHYRNSDHIVWFSQPASQFHLSTVSWIGKHGKMIAV
jgi:hypothetical protein